MRIYLLLLSGCMNGKDLYTSFNSDDDGVGQEVFGIPNVDDDDQNEQIDWEDGLNDSEDDLTDLVIPFGYFKNLSLGQTLNLVQQNDGFRVYQNGDLITEEEGDSFELVNEGREDLTLQVEMQGYNSRGTLSLEKKSGDKVLNSVDIPLQSAPLILNNHLQPMKHVYALEGNFSLNNADFISGFENALGDQFTSYGVGQYEWDVWIQDEVEFATVSSPSKSIDIVIDSIRDRGLDDVAEDEWEAPNMAVQVWGDGMATSQDSFGNLEVSPPVTVDGVEYPFGRIYFGNWYWSSSPETIVEELNTFLYQQKVQAPFELDVTWLCVGHVDEFMTFIPDASSDKGFKLLVTDVTLGYEFLEGLDSNMELPKYSDHHYDSIGEILADNSLRSLNEDIQLDYLNPALETLKTELSLTDQDIIKIPMLFEEVLDCYGSTATLFPGTVNMTVATNPDGASAKLIMPDPYLRSNLNDQSTDALINYVNALLPAGNEPYWIDDWAEYHMMLGEVHCGSNTLREPVGESWIKGRHLMEEQ